MRSFLLVEQCPGPSSDLVILDCQVLGPAYGADDLTTLPSELEVKPKNPDYFHERMNKRTKE